MTAVPLVGRDREKEMTVSLHGRRQRRRGGSSVSAGETRGRHWPVALCTWRMWMRLSPDDNPKCYAI
jgi:hypothetical protein